LAPFWIASSIASTTISLSMFFSRATASAICQQFESVRGNAGNSHGLVLGLFRVVG
jgi:hypothetical protein